MMRIFDTAAVSPRLSGRGYRSSRLGALLLIACSTLMLAATGGTSETTAPESAERYDPAHPDNVRYYGVSTVKRLQYGAWYLGLAAFLAIMSYELHETLSVRGR